MSSPAGRTPRGTPRQTIASNSSDQDSPFNALHQLAGTIKDPTTPAQTSARPPLSAHRASSRRTPRGTTAETPGANRGGNAAPATPHALRALQRRAATYTPGRDRRKSGRIQRETPIDILRNLGKALAPTTRRVSSSPQEELSPKPPVVDDLDDEPDPPRPRLSLPMGEMIPEEERSPEIRPPRLSLLVDDDHDYTSTSIEMPRRDRSIQDQATLSRVSMGSRYSDRFGDLSRMEDLEEEEDEEEEEGYMIPPEDDQGGDTTGQPVFDAGGETEDLRRFNLDFSFPTPEAATAGLTGDQGNEYDDFMLDAGTGDIDAGFPSSDSVAGGEGIQLAMQDEISRPAPQISSSPEPAPPEKTRKQQKLSRHGIPVPRLPSGIVKKLATRFAQTGGGGKSRISKETLAAIEQATEWYFEQASDDLATYSKHAGRKTIDESDVMTLMRR
ncbi:hypothetical protein FQN53_007909 [Emmonsiellopsis sp. PD_33]|nr:hypothetical protein FQN53_007909 [Emmonsiellopsis sp. PD_33]